MDSSFKQKNAKMGENIEDITSQAMKALIDYNWPGNIRELSHAMESAMLFCDTAVLELADFPMN